MPENTFAIESSNVTLILGRRGNSHVPLSSNILSVDNKLQPYTFQTHAGGQDFLSVVYNYLHVHVYRYTRIEKYH